MKIEVAKYTFPHSVYKIYKELNVDKSVSHYSIYEKVDDGNLTWYKNIETEYNWVRVPTYDEMTTLYYRPKYLYREGA